MMTEKEVDELERRERWVDDRAEHLASEMRSGMDPETLQDCIIGFATQRFALAVASIAFPSKAPHVEDEVLTAEMEEMIREHAYDIAEREADNREREARRR